MQIEENWATYDGYSVKYIVILYRRVIKLLRTNTRSGKTMPRHGTGLGAGNFPAANKLLMRYENDRAYKMHMQKVGT